MEMELFFSTSFASLWAQMPQKPFAEPHKANS